LVIASFLLDQLVFDSSKQPQPASSGAFVILLAMAETLQIKSETREQMIDITADVERLVKASGLTDGICHLYIQHTTCGLTINENADPDVQSDMLGFLQRLIPQYEPHFKHFEHNSDAHIKSSLVGCSATVPFTGGKLMLGPWQGIYLCEFDGPRQRTVVVTLIRG
jgi:secondary thiamine-phosphate synthase enzyme